MLRDANNAPKWLRINSCGISSVYVVCVYVFLRRRESILPLRCSGRPDVLYFTVSIINLLPQRPAVLQQCSDTHGLNDRMQFSYFIDRWFCDCVINRPQCKIFFYLYLVFYHRVYFCAYMWFLFIFVQNSTRVVSSFRTAYPDTNRNKSCVLFKRRTFKYDCFRKSGWAEVLSFLRGILVAYVR